MKYSVRKSQTTFGKPIESLGFARPFGALKKSLRWQFNRVRSSLKSALRTVKNGLKSPFVALGTFLSENVFARLELMNPDLEYSTNHIQTVFPKAKVPSRLPVILSTACGSIIVLSGVTFAVYQVINALASTPGLTPAPVISVAPSPSVTSHEETPPPSEPENPPEEEPIPSEEPAEETPDPSPADTYASAPVVPQPASNIQTPAQSSPTDTKPVENTTNTQPVAAPEPVKPAETTAPSQPTENTPTSEKSKSTASSTPEQTENPKSPQGYGSNDVYSEQKTFNSDTFTENLSAPDTRIPVITEDDQNSVDPNIIYQFAGDALFPVPEDTNDESEELSE